MFRTAVPAIVVALFVSGGAMAQQPELSAADKQAVKSACGAEIKKYCRAYISGDESLKSAIQSCVKDHVQDFSRGCKKSLVAAKLHQG